jgi:hydroxyacyl-ACP dehydratase HTD2-like protein with hotdog domain
MNTQKRSQTKKTKENQSKKYERIMRCFKKKQPQKINPLLFFLFVKKIHSTKLLQAVPNL